MPNQSSGYQPQAGDSPPPPASPWAVLREAGFWVVIVLGLLMFFTFFLLGSSSYVLATTSQYADSYLDNWNPVQGSDNSRWTREVSTINFRNFGYPLGQGSYRISVWLDDGRPLFSSLRESFADFEKRTKESPGPTLLPYTITVSTAGQVVGVISQSGRLGLSFYDFEVAGELVQRQAPDVAVTLATSAVTSPVGSNLKFGAKVSSISFNRDYRSDTLILPPALAIFGALVVPVLGYLGLRRNLPKRVVFWIMLETALSLSGGYLAARPLLYIWMPLLILIAVAIFYFAWRRELGAGWRGRSKQQLS